MSERAESKTTAGGLFGGRSGLEADDARALRAELDALSGELESLNRKLDQAVIDTDRRAKELLRDTGMALRSGNVTDSANTHLEKLIWAKVESRLEQRLRSNDTETRNALTSLREDVLEMGEVVNQLAMRGGVGQARMTGDGGWAYLLGALVVLIGGVIGGALGLARYFGYL